MLPGREEQLFNIILDEYNLSGEYPSYSWLASEMGYSSKRSVSLLIDRLVKKKYLVKLKSGKFRLGKSIGEKNNLETVDVNLLGDIAAGAPIFADENIEATFAISTDIATAGNSYFLLRAKGTSMNNPPKGKKAINEGDLILIKVQNHAENGDWVVALIDNSATVKEFRQNEEHIILLPHSDDEDEQKPIILQKDIRIQGIVKDVLKGIDLLMK